MSAVPQQQRYVASMVLAAVGDALGYFHGRWEFCRNGATIFKELEKMGGLDNLKLAGDWIVSDDTVLHIATAEALLAGHREAPDKTQLWHDLAEAYIRGAEDMDERAPGRTTLLSVAHLYRTKSFRVPFNEMGMGCGAAMRSMCIGLAYPHEHQIRDLVAVSIESGRMTHHHPGGYLGGLAGALFTAYALQGRPMEAWGKGLLDTLPIALEYVQASDHFPAENVAGFEKFTKPLQDYLALRKIDDGVGPAVFPDNFDVAARDAFYDGPLMGGNGWGGALGVDAPLIAYDALLGAQAEANKETDPAKRMKVYWREACYRGALHGGDNDSTGTMMGAWYGAMFGFQGVPDGHYTKLEYNDRLVDLGLRLFREVSC